MIKIVHVTEDHSIQNTGITSAVDTLTCQLSQAVNLEILSIGPEAVPVPKGVQLTLLKASLPHRMWRAAPGQQSILRESLAQANIVHLHGIWMWPQWAAAREAQRINRPIVLSTHGMLEPFMWQRQTWLHQLKKTIYWRFVAYPAFQYATIIHALTNKEADDLSNYFPGQRIEILPNSLDFSQIDKNLIDCPSEQSASPYILFLGRLHPKKGIDLLIQAFALLHNTKITLRIAGAVQEKDKGYDQYLHSLVQKLGLEKQVEFLGAVQGQLKWNLYRNAWAFFLPSLSEGLAMVNLEASACRTPVITTFQSGVTDLWASNGGMLINPNVEEVAESLVQVAQWSKSERDQRGNSLRHLVESTYSSNVLTPKWIALYNELERMSHE
jgi:glycosyltransferase involved in cell wall biosynthesis